MLVSFDALAQRFADYTDVKGKIRREVQGGRLVQVARGLYETDARTDGKYLAGAIYGQALRERLRHFFVPRRSRCRISVRRGDQNGEGIFLSDRLARKSAV